MGFFGMKKSKRAKRRNPSENARELELFIVNDGDIYQQNTRVGIKNLAAKKAKGVYDHAKAVKLWLYVANRGAQRYAKTYGGSGNGSYGPFSPADRKQAAQGLADYYLEESEDASKTKSNPRRNLMARRKATRKSTRKPARKSHKRKAVRKTVRKTTKRKAVRRSSNKLPHKVTFRKGGKHTVVFRHRKATAATKAKRRAAGKRLAKMWTKAERMANLRKAQAAWRKKFGGRKAKRSSGKRSRKVSRR